MEIKVPEVGESIREALVAQWLKQDGEPVRKDEQICELETDKINVELHAEASGTLRIRVLQGETVAIGTVIAEIDERDMPEEPAAEPSGSGAAQPVAEPEAKPSPGGGDQPDASTPAPVNPAARRLAQEQGRRLDDVPGSGRKGRVTVDDVLAAPPTAGAETALPPAATEGERPITREPMTPIRKKIAQHLLAARQQTAMLTTFNEADMGQVMALRKKHQDHFTAKHGIKLGLMSFFVKAVVEALKEVPAVNARIDGDDIVYHHYYDIGIAVGTDRGLVVPVLRDADRLTFAEIEQGIATLAGKANARKLTLAELEGGTFTISNGGVYGSVLSTPLINPPQCGVLGMHAIQDRAVVRQSEIVIRPIMNLALSYDHRLIDGREAVSFLKLIKEYIEDPSELFLEL